MYNKQQGLSIRLLDASSDIAMTMEQLFTVTKGLNPVKCSLQGVYA